jgi:cytochrome c biogenesis protein CcdA
MISVAAATLIATVYPIGVLVIAVESRTNRPLSNPRVLLRVLNVIFGFVQVAAVTGAMLSTAFCVNAVILDKVIEGTAGVIVVASGFGLQLVATGVLINLVYEKIGLIRWIERRSVKRPDPAE